MNYLITLTAFVLVLGCANERGSETAVPHEDTADAPPPPKAQVKVEPTDLSTSTSTAEIRVVVGLVNRVTEEMLSELRARVSLRTEKSARPIPAVVQVMPAASEQSLQRMISLTASTSLSAEWHELLIDLNGLDLAPYHALVPAGEGIFKSRFHPDPIPVLKSVQTCLDQQYPGDVSVRIDFSEPIDFLPKPSTVKVPPALVSLGSGECTMSPNVEDSEAGSYASVFQFACKHVDPPKELAISFERDLRTETGAIASLHGDSQPLRSIKFDFAEAYELGECMFWHLP